MWEHENRLSDAECRELLDRLFPEGPAGADVRAELAAPDEDRFAFAARIGLGLWDVFSDNNDVLAPDGRCAHLGSFRGSAGEIADWINDALGDRRFGYTDFYMGTTAFRGDEKIETVHGLIFRRLREKGCDWRYVFSALCLFDFGPPPDEPYDPAKAFAREREGDELRRRIDEINRETIEKLRAAPPPAVVRAYASVFGRLPEGWPPEA
jgi:hypothetical protein